MILPQTLSVIEQHALAQLWTLQRPRQVGLNLCSSSRTTIAQQDILTLLQQYPDIAQRPLMTLIGRAVNLQGYMRAQAEEYLAYRLEKVLQAQFRLLFPDKRGRWDQVPATGWHTVVATVRTYQAQVAEVDPTFSPPEPGDEAYFFFTYCVSCAADADDVVQKSWCTGRQLRLWREAGHLSAITDVQGLLSVLAPLLSDWLPEAFRGQPLTYQPAEEEDRATLASLLSFLQTGAPLTAFPANDGKEPWDEEKEPADYIVHVRIQASDGGGFCEHCDDEAWIQISRETLLEWGLEQQALDDGQAVIYYRDNDILDVWLEDQMVRAFGEPALQDHSHTFFFDHHAQAILDEMVELLTAMFFPANPVQ
jgi:hypothetical protein